MKMSDNDFEKLLQSEEKHSYNKTIAFQDAHEKTSSKPAIKRIAVIAATALLAVGLIITGIVTAAKTANQGIQDPPEVTDTAPIPDTEKDTETVDTTDVPQYIPEFSTPTLEEVYSVSPYSELLPKRLLSNCSFSYSYMTEYDTVVNPEDHKFLALIFKTGNELWEAMEIKVSENDGTSVFADINDKNTYALSYLYGNDLDPSEKDLEKFSELFAAENVTIDITREMVYTLPDGVCKAEISILCGDYIVSYAYTGAEITAESFFDMIMSSVWFSK